MSVISEPLVNSYVVGVRYDHPVTPNVTGATAGIPGTWTPAGAELIPKDVYELAQHQPPIVATPATPWTTGQYVQTGTAGAAGRATWTGTSWVGGAAPLEAEAEAKTKKR